MRAVRPSILPGRMDWAYYSLLVALLLAGLFINLLGLPGLWVMVVSALGYAWLTDWRYLGWPGLVALLVLALVAELVEFLAGSAGAKKAGGSKRGMIGGIVGGLLGAIFLSVIPIPGVAQLVGAIIGTFLGVVAVELLWVGKQVDHSVQIGVGTVLKTLIGVIMFFVALVTAFPLERNPPAVPRRLTRDPAAAAMTHEICPAPIVRYASVVRDLSRSFFDFSRCPSPSSSVAPAAAKRPGASTAPSRPRAPTPSARQSSGSCRSRRRSRPSAS